MVWLAWVRELKIEGDCCCGCLLLVVLPDVGNVGNSLDFFFFFFFSLLFLASRIKARKVGIN